MTTLAKRIDRLESGAGDGANELWYQDSGGADSFTSDQHPGVTLTETELAALPHTGRRITVYYVATHPTPRPW